MLYKDKKPVQSEQAQAWVRFWERISPLLKEKYPWGIPNPPSGPSPPAMRVEVSIWLLKFSGRWTPQQIDRLRDLLVHVMTGQVPAQAA